MLTSLGIWVPVSRWSSNLWPENRTKIQKKLLYDVQKINKLWNRGSEKFLIIDFCTATNAVKFCFSSVSYLNKLPSLHSIYLVLLVAILLPWFWVLTASPCNIWVSCGKAKSIEGCTNHTSSNANVERNQLQGRQVIR